MLFDRAGEPRCVVRCRVTSAYERASIVSEFLNRAGLRVESAARPGRLPTARQPGKACHAVCGAGVFRPDADDKAPNLVIWARYALAFTVAPHLQTINYRGRFSRFVGI